MVLIVYGAAETAPEPDPDHYGTGTLLSAIAAGSVKDVASDAGCELFVALCHALSVSVRMVTVLHAQAPRSGGTKGM